MNLPTKITVTRLILIPFFVVLFLIPVPECKLAGAIVFAVAGLTDWFDGHLARKYNMVTDLGKFLDAVADKVLVACGLFLAVYLNLGGPVGIIILVSSEIIIARELLITFFRTIAASKNIILAADMLGKIKAFLQFVGVFIFLMSGWAVAYDSAIFNIVYNAFVYGGTALIALSAVMALVSAIHYIVRNKQVFKD